MFGVIGCQELAQAFEQDLGHCQEHREKLLLFRIRSWTAPYPGVRYNVTRLPPDGMVKRRKPPWARRVQITVRVKKASNSAALRSS